MSLPHSFPNLRNYQVTSNRSKEYNCIAWAAGDNTRWWWPSPGYYWPRPYSPGQETLQDFINVFADAGYVICSDGSLENGYEKIAIYAKNGEPTHAARQLHNGSWTSKLGSLEDIEHANPEEVIGAVYGQIAVFMRRPVP